MSDISELESFLRTKFNAVVSCANQPEQDMPITEPFSPWEGRCFLRGLREGLFEIDEQGYVQSEVLPPPAARSTRQKMLQIFWNHGGDNRRLYREGVNQLATVARLMFDYGWEKCEVRMEPTSLEFAELAYGVDIICLGPDGSIPLCCENKRNSYELRKLSSHFEHCVSRGPHSKSDCENPANHAKYEFCRAARPKLVWFVAPAQEITYSTRYSNGELATIVETEAVLNRDSVLASGKS